MIARLCQTCEMQHTHGLSCLKGSAGRTFTTMLLRRSTFDLDRKRKKAGVETPLPSKRFRMMVLNG